jgi:acyl carrier protein
MTIEEKVLEISLTAKDVEDFMKDLELAFDIKIEDKEAFARLTVGEVIEHIQELVK